MSFKVRLQDSPNDFDIEGRESILRAGLRAGLNLGHQCMNGSCGECVATLLQGDIEAFRHADFKVPQSGDKLQFLSCCYQAKSDLLLDMPETGDARDIPLQQITTKVTRLQEIKNGIYELTLKTPRSKLLEFLAGQRAMVHLPDGNEISLGIASCPCDGMSLRFHIDQRFAPQFDAALKKGDKINIEAPFGHLTLNEASLNPLLFIAYETGFSQAQSLIDHVISQDDNRQIHLLCLTRSADGFYRENACRAWRDALDHFSYEVIYLPDNHFDNYEDFLRRMARQKSRFCNVDIYSIMPQEKINQLRDYCLHHGHPETQLRTDII